MSERPDEVWINLYRAVEMALRRYDTEDRATKHGFVRGECAWAMADDLRGAFEAVRNEVPADVLAGETPPGEG